MSTKGMEEDFVSMKMNFDNSGEGIFKWIVSDEQGNVTYAILNKSMSYEGVYQGKDTGKLNLLYVRPDWLDQGLEPWLIRSAISKAREFGYKKLVAWQPWYATEGIKHLRDNGFTRVEVPADHVGSTLLFHKVLGEES